MIVVVFDNCKDFGTVCNVINTSEVDRHVLDVEKYDNAHSKLTNDSLRLITLYAAEHNNFIFVNITINK